MNKECKNCRRDKELSYCERCYQNVLVYGLNKMQDSDWYREGYKDQLILDMAELNRKLNILIELLVKKATKKKFKL